MSNRELNASNKKKAGKGNDNSVINNDRTTDNASNYVSGDVPSSSSHKFNDNTKGTNNDKR